MSVFFMLMIIIWIIIFVYYVYSLYMVMKNVKSEYENDKFKIFGLLLFITKTYFNEVGIKYLIRIKYLAVVLFVFSLILSINYFEN